MAQKSGSLSKLSCVHCWLPPQENSTLCRKCTMRFADTKPQDPTQVEWIRYHTSNPLECQNYRRCLQENRIKTHVIPEDCLYCSTYLLKNSRFQTPHAAILQTIHHESCSFWTSKFIRWQSENRDELFEFVATALDILYDTHSTCLKLLTALLYSFGDSKKKWVLEELVLRPSAIQHVLHPLPRTPSHIHPQFWGYMEEFEEYWRFWESMIPAAKRRLKFRSLRYKEELMARAWHPDRFLAWCSDVEEREECHAMWGIRI